MYFSIDIVKIKIKRTKKDQSKQFEWQVTTERIGIKKQPHIVPENLVVQRMSHIPAGRIKKYERFCSVYWLLQTILTKFERH